MSNNPTRVESEIVAVCSKLPEEHRENAREAIEKAWLYKIAYGVKSGSGEVEAYFTPFIDQKFQLRVRIISGVWSSHVDLNKA